MALGLVAVMLLTAWALRANGAQTERLDDLVRESTVRDCQSRSLGRDSLRQLITIISESPNVPPERRELYVTLLRDLPPISCPDS